MSDAERLERLVAAASATAMRSAWLAWAVERVEALEALGLTSQQVDEAFHEEIETEQARGEIRRRYAATLRRVLGHIAPTLH